MFHKVVVHSYKCLCTLFLLLFCLDFVQVKAQGNFIELPYFEGFEDTTTYSSWILNAGPNGQGASNKWYISNADAFVGENALYISSDGGNSLSYVNTAVYNVAYKELALPKGTYDLSFTWKCVGEIDADGLQVFWLSSKMSTNSSATSEPTFMKGGKLVFEGREFLCGSKEWQTSTTTLTQQSTTPYKLVFVWKNDASATNPNLPSIIVDNIQIASQSCGKPENVTATALSTDVTVRWNGGATGYEMMYRLYGDNEVHTVKGINQTSYTLKNMKEGVYDLFVRSCCPDDTSIWVVQNNVLVYDPASHCIDFIDWNREGTECRTGNHTIGGHFDNDKFVPNVSGGSQNKGAVDYGYNSSASRHTKHYIPGEVDPRTGNMLPTVPEGEVVSVRLGNWNIGGEFESVTYTHQIDSGSNMILLLKYAIVIEDPGEKQGHKREEQPVFMLELLDEYDNPLDPSGCGDANFVANTTELIENPNADGTWHVINAATPILWKEWTTVGINMTEYAKYGPLKFKIRLTTFDCAQSGHFGYAYYTLNCTEATIEGLSCGENAGANINAPIGFNYRWYRVRDNKTVCKTQNLQGIEKNDTALYRCKVMFAQDSTCYFELDASLLPRFPKAQFSPRWVPQYCNENNIRFQNTSHVTTARGATGEKCETHRWYLKEGDNWKMIHEGDSLTYRFPNGGGSYDVRLETGISNDECIDDTIITVHVPRLGAIEDTICDTICEGKSVKIEGRKYMQEGLYRVFRGTSFGGCDSTVYLDLKVIPKQKDTIEAYICSNEEYVLNGQVFSRTGKYRTVYKADPTKQCECDTVVTLFLNVANLDISDSIELCSGDDLVIEYSVEETNFTSFEVLFNDPAKTAGLKDVEKRPVPEDGRIVLKASDISVKTTEINPVTPGNYVMNILFYYVADDGTTKSCEYEIVLNVLYSQSTIEQKFDNMITLLDSEHNGGYEFSGYQWYKNGEPLVGETDNYLFLEDVEVNKNDVYTVELFREGESVGIKCCGLKLDEGTALENVDNMLIDVASNMIEVGDKALVIFEENYTDCVVRWWSTTGIMLGEERVSGDTYLSTTPQQQGVYLLEFVVGDERGVKKVVIK